MNYAPGTRWREWPVFRDYHAGFTARAAALGYGVEDFSLPEAGNARRAGEILRHRGYAGLVLAPSAGPLSRSRLDLTGFPAVTLGHSLRFPRLHYAVGDVFRCCTDTLHTLKRLGYRRPGFAAVYAHDARIEHRASSAFLGWQALFVAAEQRVPVCLAPAEKFTAAIETWFRAEKPDVVIGLGVSTGRTLERCGAGFPRDAGFASLSLDADDEPRFSGMKMDHAGMGEAAADLLHAQILRGEAGVPDHLRGVHVEARWHPGETVCRR
jgi:DNA-binding LacI/PurR family transcriptional regulator